MKEFFNLKCDYQDMSPVIIPSGYTKDYIDGKVSWQKKIQYKAAHCNFTTYTVRTLTCCYIGAAAPADL
jgi:hypothetical protein